MNMMQFTTKKKRPNTLLGLSLDGNRLEAVVLRRINGSMQPLQTLSTPLALSPLSGDPVLVGREIRNHLDAAGIREKNCVVCLPLNWLLTAQASVPDLPDEDVASFLEIEAEKGFHSGSEHLIISSSVAKLSTGESHASLMAVSSNQVTSLEEALKSAQLKPLGFSMGITALASLIQPASMSGSLLLLVGSHGIELQASFGGGIAALRTLDSAFDTQGPQTSIDTEVLAREIRITLGQLPGQIAQSISVIRVLFRGEIARQSAPAILKRLQSTGLRVEPVERFATVQISALPVPDMTLSPALAIAARYLTSETVTPEFLPPKISQWKLMMNSGLSSRKLVSIGMGAGACVVLVGLAFAVQEVRIYLLESQWKKIQPQVSELQDAKSQISKYRPWYDTSFKGLRILKRITEAFPEEGRFATAKNLDIREMGTISCSGIARDNQAYLAVLDKLRSAEEITNLKTEFMRGQSPVQFTLSFNWEGGGQDGN